MPHRKSRGASVLVVVERFVNPDWPRYRIRLPPLSHGNDYFSKSRHHEADEYRAYYSGEQVRRYGIGPQCTGSLRTMDEHIIIQLLELQLEVKPFFYYSKFPIQMASRVICVERSWEGVAAFMQRHLFKFFDFR